MNYEFIFTAYPNVVLVVKNPPAMQETQEMLVPSLGWEDPLEEENSNPLWYSRLGNPMDRGAWWVTDHGATRVRHNSVTENK